MLTLGVIINRLVVKVGLIIPSATTSIWTDCEIQTLRRPPWLCVYIEKHSIFPRIQSNVNRFLIFSSRFHESLFFFEKVWGLRPRYHWVSDVYSGMFVGYA